MSKELLKITHIKDGVCETEARFDNPHERDVAAAALLSLMDQDEELAMKIITYVGFYIMDRKGVARLNKISMAQGKKKIEN